MNLLSPLGAPDRVALFVSSPLFFFKKKLPKGSLKSPSRKNIIKIMSFFHILYSSIVKKEYR